MTGESVAQAKRMALGTNAAGRPCSEGISNLAALNVSFERRNRKPSTSAFGTYETVAIQLFPDGCSAT